MTSILVNPALVHVVCCAIYCLLSLATGARILSYVNNMDVLTRIARYCRVPIKMKAAPTMVSTALIVSTTGINVALRLRISY